MVCRDIKVEVWILGELLRKKVEEHNEALREYEAAIFQAVSVRQETIGLLPGLVRAKLEAKLKTMVRENHYVGGMGERFR